ENYRDEFVPLIQPLLQAARQIRELFIGVSVTGFVILLKADNPDDMIEHMQAPLDPNASVHYETQEDGSLRWQIKLSSPDLPTCRLYFTLPDLMLRVLDEDAARRVAALN